MNLFAALKKFRFVARPVKARYAISVMAALVVGIVGAGRLANAETGGQLVYRVIHATYGDIGTYTNRVVTTGGMTTVKTSVHFRVSVLGVTLHREDAERTERWQGDRLVYFHGVTRKNGSAVEISGEAQGNAFIITSPLGTISAPASVRPANPLSANSLRTNAMMRVDTGKVELVKVGAGRETTVQVGGESVPTREYQVSGESKYTVWIDRRDVPVKFIVDDDSGEVTFSLER